MHLEQRYIQELTNNVFYVLFFGNVWGLLGPVSHATEHKIFVSACRILFPPSGPEDLNVLGLHRPHSTEIFKQYWRNISWKYCKIAKIFRNVNSKCFELILLKYCNNLAMSAQNMTYATLQWRIVMLRWNILQYLTKMLRQYFNCNEI